MYKSKGEELLKMKEVRPFEKKRHNSLIENTNEIYRPNKKTCLKPKK